jgi:hypothetical protein
MVRRCRGTTGPSGRLSGLARRRAAKYGGQCHRTEQVRFQDDSINVRIENLDGNVVGAIQFYNLHTYEMILIESDALRPDQEIGRRYTPGELPVLGEKRSV